MCSNIEIDCEMMLASAAVPISEPVMYCGVLVTLILADVFWIGCGSAIKLFNIISSVNNLA